MNFLFILLRIDVFKQTIKSTTVRDKIKQATNFICSLLLYDREKRKKLAKIRDTINNRLTVCAYRESITSNVCEKKVSAKNQYTHSRTHLSDGHTQRWSLYQAYRILKCQCCHVRHSRYSRFKFYCPAKWRRNSSKCFFKTKNNRTGSIFSNFPLQCVWLHLFETKIKVMKISS